MILAVSFGSAFVPLPPDANAASGDSVGGALDVAKQGVETLKNPGVRAAVVTTTVSVAKSALPAVADFLDTVPVLDLVVGGLQAGYGAYQATQAYKETYDRCMAGSN